MAHQQLTLSAGMATVETSLSLLQFALLCPLNRDLGVQEHDKYNVQSLNTGAVASRAEV